MMRQENNAISYKWDPETGSGYRLRFNDGIAKRGLNGGYHVEDWNHDLIVDDWGCDTLEDALRVLNRFFDIDINAERDILQQHFKLSA